MREDEKALVAELNNAGHAVSRVWDLVNSNDLYPSALPILVRHLSQLHHKRVAEGILRALAVKGLSPEDKTALLSRYRSETDDEFR